MPKKRNAKFVLDIFASKISILILGSLTVWLGYSVAKEAYRKHQVQVEIEGLKQEILQLENKNSDLSSILESFSDPRSVELEAKRRLNLKKPGEEVAVILRGKNDEPQNISQDAKAMNQDTIDSKPKTTPSILVNAFKWWQYITGSH